MTVALLAVGDDIVPGRAVLVGNFDGAGTLDVLLVEKAGAALEGATLASGVVLFSFANATMGAEMVTAQIGGRQGTFVRDVDGDGHDDVVSIDAPNEGAGRVFIVRGGEGASAPFTQVEAFDVAERPSPAIADVDGGGTLDLAVAHHGAEEVWVFFAAHAGKFDATATVFAAPAAQAIAVGDLDEDELPDLVLATAEDTVVVMPGFDAEYGEPLPIASRAVRALELGRLDLAAGLDVLMIEMDDVDALYAEHSK
jgi:hypothetical protein